MAAGGRLATAAAQAQAPAQPAACTDFYAHVNHDWLQKTVLPPDRARIGSFDELRIANDRVLERAMTRLLAEPARQDTPGLKLLAAWYRSGLDPAIAERAGLAAVQPLLDRINGLRDPAGLPALLAELSRHRVAVPLSVWIGPDVQDVRRHVLTLGQDGLGLPDRDDYLKDDDTSRRLRAAYRVHAERLLQLAGAPHDAATLDALMAFETTLAQAAMTRVERRDPQATNNRRTLAALQAEAPGFDWAAWLAAMGIVVGDQPLVLSQPRFAQALARGAGSTPVPVWQAYLRVQLLDQLAPWLAPAFQQAHFEFHERVQRGLQSAAEPARAAGAPDRRRRRLGAAEPDRGRALRARGLFTAGAAARRPDDRRRAQRDAHPHPRPAVDERAHQAARTGQAGGDGAAGGRARALARLHRPGAGPAGPGGQPAARERLGLCARPWPTWPGRWTACAGRPRRTSSTPLPAA